MGRSINRSQVEQEDALEGEAMVQPPDRGCTTSKCLAKTHTRGVWVLIMVLLGTFDVFISWVNVLEMSHVEMRHGLITGPPPVAAWRALFVFSVVSSALYFVETANTFSVFCHGGGTTSVSLIYDLAFTLAFKHLPLNALNYYIALCRSQYFTLIQTLCGTSHMSYGFVRMLWYAHMEGKILHLSEGSKIRNGVFLLCCALFATSMAMPVMCWRSRPSTSLDDDAVKNTSLFLFDDEHFNVTCLPDCDISELVLAQGGDVRRPSLIPNLHRVIHAGPAGLLVTSECHQMNHSFTPEECHGSDSLLFKFIYYKEISGSPYGTIRYNFATVTTKPEHLAPNGTCVDSETELSWGLYYLSVKPHLRGALNPRVIVNRPWKYACITPTPWYDERIAVCSWDHVLLLLLTLSSC